MYARTVDSAYSSHVYKNIRAGPVIAPFKAVPEVCTINGIHCISICVCILFHCVVRFSVSEYVVYLDFFVLDASAVEVAWQSTFT